MVNVVSKELREILNRQKRAQYSRIRYHSMDPVLRSSFNEKRSKRYFIKKKKERALLSMSLNKLTADEYLEVQQISKRRKARSEKARLRYHKLSLGILLIKIFSCPPFSLPFS